MAQIVSPFRLGKALSYQYKISTEQLHPIPYHLAQKPKCPYYVDIAVDQHPDYPSIPPSVWTVRLLITENGVAKSLYPKNGPDSLKRASILLMDWNVRMYTGWADVDNPRPLANTCEFHIGTEGWKSGMSQDSVETVEAFYLDEEMGYRLKDDTFLLISITFVVEKSAGRRDLEMLLDSGLLSDCQMVCGEQQFPVQRAILAAQSPVFEAMFSTDMQEKASGIVEIKDMIPDILLKYIYTQDLMINADAHLMELWTAADKYDIVDLKKLCERRMLACITDENALKYVVFGAERGLDEVKVEAAKIISQQPIQNRY